MRNLIPEQSAFLVLMGAWALLAGGMGVQAEDVVASEAHRFRVETIAEGLENPWSVERLPDGTYLISERAGRLRVVREGRLEPEPVRGTPEVWARGQGGLLDIELHPQFQENGWIYLSYSKPFPKGSLTAIVRGRIKDGAWVDQETVFDPPAEQASGSMVHFGCRMDFDAEGLLYFSIGDRGDKLTPENNAQQFGNVMGKVHRIHDDGRIPPDNPFVGKPGAAPSIWSLGNRNIQGLRFEPGTGRLWASEHGPRGGDELNIIRKGLNYGWPVVSHGIQYDGRPFTDKTEAPGMEPPVVHWTPSIAVCGMDFYRGEAFPKWKGNLFISALASERLVRVVLEGERVVRQEVLLQGTGRMRDVRCFEDGAVTVVYDQARQGGGKVVRLVPVER